MPPTKPFDPQLPCPCGSSLKLELCCLAYLQDERKAPTAEALMRSRYTAHVLLDVDYLWRTWSPSVRKRSSKAAIHQWASTCEWLGLSILQTLEGQVGDKQGKVHFTARYRENGQEREHEELSLFQWNGSRWLYIDHFIE